MSGNGWIKLYRKFEKWEWYQDSRMVHLFIHLLISANSKDGKWQGYNVKRGEVVTGLHSIKNATKISIQRIRTGLDRLTLSGEIAVKSTSKFSIITICNYEDYQEVKKENNKQTTNKQQTNNKQITTNKKLRSKELKKTTINNFDVFWKAYPRKLGKFKAKQYWGKLDFSNGLFEKIMGSLEQFKKTEGWVKDDGKYIPHGSTWVYQKKWEDDVEEIAVFHKRELSPEKLARIKKHQEKFQ